MTLDEAIEQNIPIGEGKIWHLTQRDLKAIRLGIEALKRIRHDRNVIRPVNILLLPGETED